MPLKTSACIDCLAIALLAGCMEPKNNHSISDFDSDGAAVPFDTSRCLEEKSLPVFASVWRHRADGEHPLELSNIVFDDDGNLIAADRSGHLVRFGADGTREVWLENSVKTLRDGVFLSNGELVVADSGIGALVKIRPDGTRLTLVSHLDFPSGVALDSEGYVYVAEQTRHAILRVDATTGKRRYIAETLPHRPSALVFSPNEERLYFTTSDDAGIYVIQRDSENRFAAPVLIATLPASVDVGGDLSDEQTVASYAFKNSCADSIEGDSCTTSWGTPGACRDWGGDELYCAGIGPCDDLQTGDECVLAEGGQGICREDDGNLVCAPVGSCVARTVGDPCTTASNEEGTCRKGEAGALTCVDTPPCYNKQAGDICSDEYGVAGMCEDAEDGDTSCVLPPPCEGKSLDDPCPDPLSHLIGRCLPGAGGELVCQPKPPCQHKNEGDPCALTAETFGTCIDVGPGGDLWCYRDDEEIQLNDIVTDACGNLYVTAADSDVVWRVSPNGDVSQPFTQSLRTSITGAAFGSGIGGWDADTLYLAVNGGEEIVAVPVGLPEPSPSERLNVDVDTSLEDTFSTPVDCLSIPDEPISVTELDAPRGYHDLAFDKAGYILGFDGNALLRVNREGDVQVYATGLDVVEGFDRLPDGRLAVATDRGLMVIAPNGSQTILATDIFAYGITVGPDGLIYAADNHRVYRVDAETGDKEVLLDPPDFLPRSINFDPDFTLMYLSTLGDAAVYVVPLDNQMTPFADPVLLTTIQGTGNQDALGVDICGNLYITDFNTAALYRISPDGAVHRYLQWDHDRFGHGIEWGSGIGGFDDRAIYLPQPNDGNTVVEVVIGVTCGSC